MDEHGGYKRVMIRLGTLRLWFGLVWFVVSLFVFPQGLVGRRPIITGSACETERVSRHQGLVVAVVAFVCLKHCHSPSQPWGAWVVGVKQREADGWMLEPVSVMETSWRLRTATKCRRLTAKK